MRALIQPKWFLLNNGWFWVAINKNATTAIKQHRVDYRYRKPDGPKLAVIRNPYDRLVSCWVDRFADFGEKPWEKFLDHVLRTPDDVINSHARCQHINLDPYPDKLIPFERLEEEFREIGIELKRANKSARSHWYRYYTVGQKALVRERFAEDFRIWEQLQ